MSPRAVGLIIGLVIGITLVLAGWRVVLILLAFTVGGYFVGSCLEPGSVLAASMRRFYFHLFRS